MKKKICLFILSIFSAVALSSCTNTNQTSTSDNTTNEQIGPYGEIIAQNLTSTNIIEDKNRNYYEIFVKSFCDSNGDGIGDLNGVTQKLDYLKSTGYNGIWLMPINQSPSYHKYDVQNYFEVDSSYGTIKDLKNLINACHERNITVIMDMVFNHSSKYNPLFSESVSAHKKYISGLSLSNEEEKMKDFYSFYDSESEKPNNITCYKVSGETFYYEGNFTSDMPEFNYDNEYVYEYINSIMKYYLDLGIDGFRLDAVKYYYFNSTDKNIKVLNKFVEYARSINKDCYFVGECWEGSGTITDYYKSNMDSFFNFDGAVTNPSGFITNSTNRDGLSLKKYYDGMINSISMANGNTPAVFIDNHDTPRFMSSSLPEENEYQYALLQMLNGASFTYYGDEVGMVGTNAGENNPDENVRLAMKWEKNSPNNCRQPSGITTSSYPYGTVEEQINDKNSIYNFYKKSLLIRNQNPEISRGTVSLISLVKEDEQKTLFISKEYNGSKIGIIFNFSGQLDATVSFKESGFNDVVGQLVVGESSTKYIGLQDDGSIKLPPYSIAIVR